MNSVAISYFRRPPTNLICGKHLAKNWQRALNNDSLMAALLFLLRLPFSSNTSLTNTPTFLSRYRNGDKKSPVANRISPWQKKGVPFLSNQMRKSNILTPQSSYCSFSVRLWQRATNLNGRIHQ